ncbi:MAG: hypothetical protein CME26_12710 [Gemmatimonadetes bacterium]|nr:hypothetical protein [Gemmatimonadota bacterium]
MKMATQVSPRDANQRRSSFAVIDQTEPDEAPIVLNQGFEVRLVQVVVCGEGAGARVGQDGKTVGGRELDLVLDLR